MVRSGVYGGLKCLKEESLPQVAGTKRSRSENICYSHPTQFRFPFCISLPSTWSLMLGNAFAEYQSVLGSPIARSIGHRRTQGTMLCYGREEPGPGSRNGGPEYPDIRPLKPNYALQSWCLIIPRPRSLLNAWLIVELSLCLFPVDGSFAVEMADENDCCVSERGWVRPRFDRRESSDPVRSLHLFLARPGLWINLLLTFCGPRPRNIEDKDQE